MNIIVDTDILIDAGRDDRKAKDFIVDIEKKDIPHISAITQMELLVGARNKLELREIEKFIRRFAVISLDIPITAIAVNLLTEYRLSYGLAIPDALIAATALANNFAFATKNAKDFQFIAGLVFAKY